MLLTLSAHARDSYSSQSVFCLCTADLEGCCITTVKTSTNDGWFKSL